ncbi:MAG: serine/threonine protein kinase [Proteobacteria bacterium]|nr:serine/threonine protein kinase [Pseudomonadota bacterium]
MTDITVAGNDVLALPGDVQVGDAVGPFKILRQLGEGGFGAVFEAGQEQPVRRRVALKVIKLGMDTREFIVRFEAERQALALMDHPHIATVLDAGATDSGRPYFVMELVEGESITGYCATLKLSILARLQLFEQVCAAVQHAHTKGVIHRDLKPSNILVSTHDDAPFAKVIDFGIAKATRGRLTEQTMRTEANLMMGTPAYMSPEQAEGSADIDTRTDIYSLGVILYELLTDSTPLDSNTLRSAGHTEVQRIIREVEPPLPSARLSQSNVVKSAIAARRQIDPRKLSGLVRGELDWIVMKAIEKDRGRRYESPAALAADVRRFLDGNAVLAAPPSTVYRLRKYVARHKAAVTAAALVTLSLLVGIAGFGWQAQIAKRRAAELEKVTAFQAAMFRKVDATAAGERLTADVSARFDASLRNKGVAAAERARRVQRFTADWQEVNATDAARGVLDQNVLRPAVAQIGQQFAGEPLIAARLRETLAGNYSDMGMYDDALNVEAAALASHRKLLGENDVRTAVSEYNMGTQLQAKGEAAKAELYYLAALRTYRAHKGEDDPDTLGVLGNLASLYGDMNRPDLAEPLERDVLASRRRVLGNGHPDTLLAVLNMGVSLRDQRKFDQAEPLLREAFAGLSRVAGANAEATIYANGNIALLEADQGKLDAAERDIRDVLARSRRTFGEEYSTTLLAAIAEAGILIRRGKAVETERLLAPIEAAARTSLSGDNAFWFGTLLMHLGQARAAQVRYAPAEANLLEAERLLRQPHVPVELDDLRDCTKALVDLYIAWHKAEPGKGYDAKAVQWQHRLAQMGAPQAATSK